MSTTSVTAVRKWSHRNTWLAVAALAIACLAAYSRTFHAPFVYDDDEVITGNLSLRHLWRVDEVLFPAGMTGTTVSGRPILNLTLAVNYAISGLNAWSYHALNLLIHFANGLLLAGIIRRTLRRPTLAARFQAAADPLALATAALWLLHPLQTEAVTYVAQRAESLMGFFYLLTLFAYVRATESQTSRRWLACSVAACALGMATKEVMVSAPLIVLLYDRCFIAGTWRKAMRGRPIYYIALASTWILLAVLVLRTDGRGDSAGFTSAVTPWHYALTQCGAITHYLRLAIWPVPLVFDYGTSLVQHFASVWPQAIVVLAVVGGTIWALRRGHQATGFLGAWFLAILAPSSSVVPIATQTMAEHRMYLPVAAIVVAAAAGLYRLIGRRAFWILAAAALSAGGATFARNEDYRSRRALWADTVEKRPANARAHNNLAIELAAAGDRDAALAEWKEALRLQPTYADAHNNLGNALLRRGELPAAMDHYEKALQAQPDFVLALDNLGLALLQTGRLDEAQERYEHALRLDTADLSAHLNLGYIQLRRGNPEQALRHYKAAAQLQPESVEAQRAIANTLMSVGRPAEAVIPYKRAVALSADDAALRFNLALALAQTGALAEANEQVATALKLSPDFAEARRLHEQLQARLRADDAKRSR